MKRIIQFCLACLLGLSTLPFSMNINAEPNDTDVVRIKGNDRFATSLRIAAQLKETLGVEKFDSVIFVDGRNFADALAGSSLAARKNAPIIMIDKNNEYKMDSIRDFLNENLKEDGLVYVLGGEAAVPDFAIYTGFTSTRLKGTNRYGTNLEILKEIGVHEEEILVANAKNFADSLSASATGLPLLLVGDALNSEQKAFLEEHPGCSYTILGGTGAVSTEVEEGLKQYGNVRRLSGKTRYETSIEIAKTYFPNADSAVFAYAKNFPDGLCGGPLAYVSGSPLILTATGNTVAQDYTNENNINKGIVLGGASLIDDESVEKMTGSQPTLVEGKDPVYYTVTYKIDPKNKGSLSFSKVTLYENRKIDDQVPMLTIEPMDIGLYGWEFVGYLVDGVLYDRYELENLQVTKNLVVEVVTRPDIVGYDPENDEFIPGDDIDDRLQSKVYFRNYNWEIIGRQVVMKGEDANPPTVPERYGFEFAGWDKSYQNVQEDELSIVAKYNKTVNGIVVHFMFDPYNSGAGQLSFENIVLNPGEKLKKLPEVIFTQEEISDGWKSILGEDANETYFGWARENRIESLCVTTWERISVQEILNTPQTKDITYRISIMQDKLGVGTDGETFSPDGIDDKSQSIVTYVDWNDQVVKKEVVINGSGELHYPEPPEREGYDFVCWENEDGETVEYVFDDTIMRAVYQKSMPLSVWYYIEGDGTLRGNHFEVDRGMPIGDCIPEVRFSYMEQQDGWKIESYEIRNGVTTIHSFKTKEELSEYIVNEETDVYIQTIPDRYGQGENNNVEVPDGIDDRQQAVVYYYDLNYDLIKAEVLVPDSCSTPPEPPVERGYTFTGWRLNEKIIEGDDPELENVKAGARIYLYANYEEGPEKLITVTIREGDRARMYRGSYYIKSYEDLSNEVQLLSVDVFEGWKFDGYYIDGIKYTAEELATYFPEGDITIEVRTYPDMISLGCDEQIDQPDNIDDRLQPIVCFYLDNETLLKKQCVMKGTDATPPEVDEVGEGLMFCGWRSDYTNIQENMSIYALIEPKK